MKEATLKQEKESLEVKLPPPKENPNKAEFGDLAAFVDEETIQRLNLNRNPVQYGDVQKEQKQY
ncbi:hypothetical protein ACFLZB_02310 [Nanoarchaeota archaeon]